ncbi:unnamed protein product [Euphydryas editha]|uniref:CCHC-type domain-containing protein n=1 Tax=Euphydryas editha TaxID=104508 RepID=A0AAU9V535_EUPED|nr:unnamed protein product [Euphydryas editha]
MEKFIITHFEKRVAGEESTAVDSDDDRSAATGDESSCGQTRSGKRFRRSSRSPGEEASLAGVKKRFIMRDEPCTEAEKAILEQARAAEEGRRALGVNVGDPRTADALVDQVATDVDLICKVATRSSNLKGEFVRTLKDAAASIKSVVEALKERTTSEEVRRLQAENSRLRRDLEDLRRQVVELRGQRSQQSAPTCLPRPEEGLVEKVSASVIRATPAPVRRRRTHASEDLASAVQAGDGEWTTVAKRKKKKAPKSYAAAAAATPAPKGPQPQPPAKKKKRAKKPKLAAPRSPAVLVTLDEYAVSKGVTYCHLLKRAAETIDLAELGIVGGLKLRRAATGARLLELPKGQTPEAAGRLAEAMQTALGEMAMVVQPMKLASLRVSGLDDSISCEMVAAAAAQAGKCDVGSVKVGAIAVGPGGLGCTVVRCPIPVAKALAEAGRLLVGWSSASFQVLEQRPMRCYKCMGIGHTRPTCPAAVDRRGACFRCGVEGHIARNCTGALRCAVCADAGKPASHIMGGRECCPPKSRVRAVAKAPTAPQISHQSTEETAAMSS